MRGNRGGDLYTLAADRQRFGEVGLRQAGGALGKARMRSCQSFAQRIGQRLERARTRLDAAQFALEPVPIGHHAPVEQGKRVGHGGLVQPGNLKHAATGR